MKNSLELQGTIQRSLFLIKEIKKIIDQKDITLTSLAQKMGVSHAYISANISGKKIPSDELLRKILINLGMTSVEIEDLFYKADKIYMKNRYNKDDYIDEVDFEQLIEENGVNFSLNGMTIGEEDKKMLYNIISGYIKGKK